jgi:hypothetical protein
MLGTPKCRQHEGESTRCLDAQGLSDSFFDESIPNPANRIQIFRGGPQLLPQTPHVSIDRSSINDIFIFPNVM